jgi:apolipoprotein N-acyltransferase
MRRYWHMIVLGCWTLACFSRFAPHGGFSWHYFTLGSAVLFGGALPKVK